MSPALTSSTGRRPLGEFDQINVVVGDPGTVHWGMRRVFKLEPRRRSLSKHTGSQLHGRCVDNSVGMLFYDFGNLEVELLYPHIEPSTRRQFRGARAAITHHIRSRIPDDAAVHAYMTTQEVSVEQEGGSVRGGEIRYVYYGIAWLLGFFLETLSAPRREGEV